MKNRKTCAVITLLCFLLTLMPVAAFAADEVTVVNSGSCGDNATWELTSDGVLTISGSGEMRYAPWNNSLIKKVVISDGITNISEKAFYYCSNLTSIEIPNSVTSIENSAFDGCNILTSIEIPNNVISIGEYAFNRCSSLISIEIPDSVASIESGVFSYCTNLTSIAIPNGVTSIGDSAFGDCDKLESIEIPNGVTSIGKFAFGNCSSLTSIEIPNSVTSIGDSVFNGCSSLASIEIPNSITNIGDGAFRNCSSITSIEIPNSVTSIGNSTFEGCSSLTSIGIPDSVTSIGEDAFVNCSKLESIEIPNSVISIGNNAFSGCHRIETVKIPNSVISIGSGAFFNCSRMESIEISDSVTSIEDYTFNGCSSLTSVEIPNGVTSIGDEAFFYCSSLKTITIPNSVKNIGKRAFYRCGLTSIELPNGIMSIGENTFGGCRGLTAIEIPDSVTSIGNNAFSDCSNLTSIAIPDSVISIGENVFNYCYGLTSITIPDSITTISDSTFLGCSNLTTVTIPNSVTAIKYGAFENCDKITDVYYDGTEAEWNAIVIGNHNDCLKNATIHCKDSVCAHNYETSVVQPTCTEQGYTVYTCSLCGDSYQDNYVEALGHKTELRNAKPATATEAGYTGDEVCTVCNTVVKKGEVIPATGSIIENAPAADTSMFSVNTTDVQTNESFDITLGLFDKYGAATNCTTTLYVWATKVGSTIPTSALSVADAEDMGNGVYILKNKSHAEKIPVSLSRAGAYTMHVSLDGVELRGVNTKVEVEVVKPALASGLKVMVGDKILSANESYLLTENAYTDGAEFEKIYVTKNDKTGVEVTAYLLDEEGSVLKGKNLNLDSNSANIVSNKTSVMTDQLGRVWFRVTANQTGEYKLYVSWDENTVAIPVTVTAPSSGSSSSGSYGGGGGSSNPNSSNISNITVTSPDKEIKVNQSSVGNNIVKDATEAVKENTAVKVIGGKNCAVSISAKEAGTTTVSSFDEPLTVSVPVKANALKDVKDTSKLTLARVSKDKQGNTVLTYVGGNYDKQTGKFTAYVDEPGDYILVEDSNIKKVELQIGKQASAVNGTNIMNDVAPIIYNNRTMVPLRFIAETLGAQVDWNGETSTVTLTVGGVTMEMTIDKTIDGFDVAPIIYEGRTMVPIRYIAEKLGANVIYVPETQEIVVVK